MSTPRLQSAAHPGEPLLSVRDLRRRRIAQHRIGGFVQGLRARIGGAGPSALVATLAAELDAFRAAVRGDGAPRLATAADGLAVMRAVEAARESDRRGGRPVATVVKEDPPC